MVVRNTPWALSENSLCVPLAQQRPGKGTVWGDASAAHLGQYGLCHSHVLQDRDLPPWQKTTGEGKEYRDFPLQEKGLLCREKKKVKSIYFSNKDKLTIN